MKKFITFLLAMLGLNSACSQQSFKNSGVEDFAQLILQPNVIVLDVRTAEEFAQGHLAGAVNIDVKKDDFEQLAQQQLPSGKTIAVYCRSGRRSAKAAGLLAKLGYDAVNLKGGILAWQEQQMPVTSQPTHEMDTFTTPGGKTLEIHALMHACIRLVADGKEIEIDPVGKLGERTVDYTAMPKADYILVTHEHADHFDTDAIGKLSNDRTKLFTNRRCADMLGYGNVMANGDTASVDGVFSIEAVPAYNTTPGHLQFHPKGRDNGFVLTFDGMRIYIAGDTEDIPEMANLHDIDIAFLPCNQPYTMTPDHLLRAARVIKPRVLYPYHYGKTDVTHIPQQLSQDGIEVRIRHLE